MKYHQLTPGRRYLYTWGGFTPHEVTISKTHDGRLEVVHPSGHREDVKTSPDADYTEIEITPAL